MSAPTGAAAILTKVRKDIEWISSRADHVVILAHSQGAAVAHEVPRATPPHNIKLFVTIGSGINKLARIASDTERPILQHGATITVLLAPLLVWLIPTLYDFSRDLTVQLSFWSGLWLLGLVSAAWFGSKAYRGHLEKMSLEPIQWRDYYASRDPVSNGPFPYHEDRDWVESIRVRNLDSAIRDHTTYFDNEDVFIPSIFRDIDHVLGGYLVKPLGIGDSDIEKLQARRSARLRWLNWTKLIGLLLAVTMIVLESPRLPEIGRNAVAGFIQTITSRDLVGGLIEQATRISILLTGRLPAVSPEDMTALRLQFENTGYGLAGSAGICLAAYAWFALTSAIWRWWDRSERVLGPWNSPASSGIDHYPFDWMQRWLHPEIPRVILPRIVLVLVGVPVACWLIWGAVLHDYARPFLEVRTGMLSTYAFIMAHTWAKYVAGALLGLVLIAGVVGVQLAARSVSRE